MSLYLYKRVCPSVGPSVGRSVGRSIRRSVTRFFWFTENAWNRARSGQRSIRTARRAEIRRRTTYFVYTNLLLLNSKRIKLESCVTSWIVGNWNSVSLVYYFLTCIEFWPQNHQKSFPFNSSLSNSFPIIYRLPRKWNFVNFTLMSQNCWKVAK